MNVYVAGAFYKEVVKERFGVPYKDVILEVLKKALEDAEVSADDLDGMVFTPPVLGSIGINYFMHAHHMGHYLGKELKTEVMVENGGSTAALAIRYGMLEIISGRCNLVAVIGIDERSDRPLESMDFNHFIYSVAMSQVNLYGPYDALYGIGAPIPYYAMAGQRYMYEHKVSRDDLNYVAVRLRENASRNPKALLRELITPDDVTRSKEICPPLYLYDCSVFASGAACVILSSERFEKSRGNRRRRVQIRGYGEYHTPTSFLPSQFEYSGYKSKAVSKAAQEAFESAGVGRSDIDVAEIYGVFSTTELTILEDIGFFDEGKSVYAFKEGKVGIDSSLYVDPTGGRIAFGHPAGATPLIEFAEVVRQLRGEAGEAQKKGKCDLGLVQAEHGMLNGAVVFILEGKG
ncbi:MAG: thiolase family protein [Candidatus Calescibacterium sp.]|nr:thiolase family protein [Candidatus Calescibacterium sp.]MCX7733393.1 thiolase family protein [bacterium]MDW8087465.1 thiolase family protein [Candidatus Calescibacterium sp.]